ncbi:MAG: ABC transporter permease [Bacteroidetes bacterium]|nr:ABC transporter permease [Bacteroidota bacterium]
MFFHYFKVALRHLLRNKLFSVINIVGLSIGIAAAILILLYIFNEFSYDRFHENKDRIYRVLVKQDRAESSDITAIATAGIGPSMKEELPEVEDVVRLSSPSGGYLTSQNTNYDIARIVYADSSFFDVFSFHLISGNPKTALTEPYSLVITQETAHRIFGDKGALNEMVTLDGKNPLRITGIIENPPANSQLQFEALIAFSTLYKMPDMFLDWDGGWNYYTFVALNNQANTEQLATRFPDFMERHINVKYKQYGVILSLMLEPLTKVHLFSIADYDSDTKGDLPTIIIFSVIAVFILLIACINFMNLSTAQSVYRAKEVGMRKVVGATKSEIIKQFLGESLVISFLSFILALAMVNLAMPWFNMLTNTRLDLFHSSNIFLIPSLAALIVITGVIAGSYPAFYMTRFQPTRIIKGVFTSAKGKLVIRNLLVIFQFIISSALILSTLVIFTQTRFLKTKPLGFQKQNIILIPLYSEKVREKYEVVKNAFRTVPGAIDVGATTGVPGHGLTMNGYLPEGMKEPIMIHVMDVDANLLDVLEIPVVKGRGFSRESEADKKAFLINETLARQLNWDDPTGKNIMRDGIHKVIGMVRDFHFSSLHSPIGPLIITMEPWSGYEYLVVKTGGTDIEKMIGALEQEWKSVAPFEPFNYQLLEDYIREGYSNEDFFGKTIFWFAVLAVFIACLGLLGLVAFAAGRRRREIGLRKIFGAGITTIVLKISVEFAILVIIANIIAWPLAWIIMNKWLQNFAFRIGFQPWIFIVTLLLTLLISWLTVIYLTSKLARTNPAEVIKYE